MSTSSNSPGIDLFIIGGGVNGCGIARDAAGRGLRVELAEMNDLASATSSASTKLFHGGLRYLEYFEIRLVRKALIEREVLLQMMPHISWPMRFVLPYHRDMRYEGGTPTARLLGFFMPWLRGRRPAWLIRLGLFMYDNLGGRKILPGTTSVDLTTDMAGQALQERFKKAYEYSDCWVEDSRLVVLNARDAEARGAVINTRTKVIRAERQADHWVVTLEDMASGDTREVRAKMLVNAAGPWVEDIISNKAHINTREGIRLVRGSHIVTQKLFDHDKSYILQGEDGRIIFAIPYETDFTLIGTTEAAHENPDEKPVCTEAEAGYLIEFASKYFQKPVSKDDVVWSYSGVRPLYEDGASSATAATREYVLTVNHEGGAPVLNVFGGKITTYRILAEAALDKIAPYFDDLPGKWTAGVAMPGGDFPVDGVAGLISDLQKDYPFLGPFWARRLIKAYGTEARDVLGNAKSAGDLGQDFGATLTEREVLWLMRHEFARGAEDIVWRRSKMGLRMRKDEIATLEDWMKAR